MRQQAVDLAAAQHDWQAGALRRLGHVEKLEFATKNGAVEKQQGALGLILSSGGHVASNRKIGQKRLDLGRPKLSQIRRSAVPNESEQPAHIGSLGRQCLVPKSQLPSHLLDDRRWSRCQAGVPCSRSDRRNAMTSLSPTVRLPAVTPQCEAYRRIHRGTHSLSAAGSFEPGNIAQNLATVITSTLLAAAPAPPPSPVVAFCTLLLRRQATAGQTLPR